ncbi:putative signal transducing protein [Luteolibacter marinus]|uniref:putative signal transducing protein n=1 Tax=Luteolibacter marinus TaxID=2776705 RepID=UPI001866AE46
MKRVFDHIDFTIVGHLQSVLEAAGIRTEIRNEGGSGAAGELPFTQVYPELWVLENQDEARARALIKEFRDREHEIPVGPAWTCPACGEEIEGQFAECWNCGAENPL